MNNIRTPTESRIAVYVASDPDGNQTTVEAPTATEAERIAGLRLGCPAHLVVVRYVRTRIFTMRAAEGRAN